VVKRAATLRERLLAVTTSDLAGAPGVAVLEGAVRKLAGPERIAGPAVTAGCEPRTVGAMLRALRSAGPGDVLCVVGAGEWAYFGELAGAEALRRGLAGVVVDGLVRDLDGLEALGLGLFGRGTTPVGGSPRGKGEVGAVVRLGGCDVEPGDWVVGDADGVVVVEAGRVDEALEAAEAAVASEREMLTRIAAGESLFELGFRGGPPLDELLGR
jgi:4-hydroxy-4-methyl-2-oxoglutarate aldolase